ncbi:MAG: molybdopterin-dependent oxidoreductase [Sphingomonadales bacterium]|nr:molybdopterin-dependent oxidoreductase [Sphingomonadales bacterium]
MANRAEAPRIEFKRSYCKVCMTNCGIVAEVEDDCRILSVKADRDHPVTKGYSCPKGRATGQIYHLDGAITRPLMRKDGALVEVEWDEALDDVAARLRATIDAHGPHAVGMYFGSGLGLDSAGYAMEEALYHALGTPPKFSPLTNDTTAKTMISGAMARFYGINPKTDYDACKLVLYVGTNPMVSHAHNTGMFNPGMWFKTIRKRGGEIWVIDPVRTETADFAAGHIAAWPGRDYAVLAWLVREVLADSSFAPRQPVRNLDALRALLAGYDLPRAAAIAGVEAAQMEGLLAAIRRHRIVAVETGTGSGMSPGGNLTVWFAWLLGVLTGSINVPGGVWLHPGALFPFDRFTDHLPLLDSPFTASSNVRPDVKGICGDWPCAVLPQEIEAGNIAALFNFGGHLLRSFPDANALRAALPKLDLLVSTEITHNELSPLCTHILPTKATVERAEFTRWDTLNWSVSLQYAPALVKPMGERRSAWWVIAEIMRRAGLPVADHVPTEHSDANDDLMQSLLLAHARCSWAELKEKRVVEFPRELPAPWVDRFFARIGGWELMPPEVVAQWHSFRAEDEAALGQPRPLVYTSRRQRRKFNGQIDFLGEIADCLIHPETAAQHGVVDGQPVRVWNASGEITVTARIDPGTRRGVCSIPHGHGEANVNLLTSTHAMDPLGGMAHYSAVPVEIAPA